MMNSNKLINTKSYTFCNFSEIIDKYDTFILDIWGVMHDGFHPYPGAVECVKALLNLNKNITFLSNAPRPGTLLIKKLIEFGIPADTPILSSGDAVRMQLETFSDPIFRNLSKRCYHLGAARNHDILAGIDVEVTTNIEDAGFILLTVYADEDEDLNQYDNLFEKALHHGIPAICANPDADIINGDKVRYCAGVFAKKYEIMGGKVHYYGKPHPTVYELIFEKLNKYSSFNKQRILMVGDTLETDILGANRVGIHSALTHTGNTELYLTRNSGRGLSDKDLLNELFETEVITPNWIIPRFSL